MQNISTLKPLLEDCKRNPTEHFKPVYDALIDKVYAYVAYRVSTKEQATDLTQDIFIDLYGALPGFTYRSDAEFYGFLFTLTKRKLARLYANQTDRTAHEQTEDETILPAPDEDREMSDEVERALSTLDPETKEIIVLHHWSRYTFPEIATLLNITESTARVRHHRALKTLSTIVTST